MRHDPVYSLWVITCPSAEDCQRLREWLPAVVAPEATFADDVRAFPEGTEVVRHETHRLGDYFESVRVWPPADDQPTSLRLLFRRRPDAGRF